MIPGTLYPATDEWSIIGLPRDRQSYLQKAISFEEITDLIAKDAQVRGPTRIVPYESATDARGRKARQVVFRLKVSPRHCDLFFNASCSLRASYWVSPDQGFLATKHFIRAVKPKLLASLSTVPPTIEGKKTEPMSEEDIKASLGASSAKVWPYEKDEHGNISISPDGKPQIHVRRWELNESNAPVKGIWRWAPDDRDLEIKGGLLDPEGSEHIPPRKRDRSCQIHFYGFT